VVGTAEDLYGQTADAARETAFTFDKWLRPKELSSSLQRRV
jgi:hypothetical protein